MRLIPLAMREELAALRRMKECTVKNLGFGECTKKLEWDHVWQYAGRQINEPWAILAVCSGHHYDKPGNRLLNEAIMRASLRLTTEEDLAKYPRKNWAQIKRSLGLWSK